MINYIKYETTEIKKMSEWNQQHQQQKIVLKDEDLQPFKTSKYFTMLKTTKIDILVL